MEAVAATASVITLVEVSAKIATGLLQYTTAVRAASSEITHFHQSLESLRNVLEQSKQLLDRHDAARLLASQNLLDALKDCRSQLEELQQKLHKRLPKPDSKRSKIVGSIGASSLLWPFQSKEVEKLVDRFERWKATINLALMVDQTSVVLDISQKIDLAKLPSAEGAAFDSHADEHEARCLEGTRTDLLLKVSHWADAPDGKLIFWLNGMAGTGKSTISRTVAQDLADKGQLAASFFFKRGEAHRGDATRFFTTIAAQLASRFPVLVPHIKEAVDSDPEISKKVMTQQFEKLVLQPLSQTKGSSLPEVSKIIVIDALDECEREQDIRTILRLLTRVKELQPSILRFFVTSRPERPPRLGFRAMSEGNYEDLILEEVAPLSIEHDISVFLEHEFAKIRDDYNNTSQEPPPLPADWPGPQKIRTLLSTALPLFISAATTCLFIKDPRFDPRDRLDKVLTYQTSSHASKFDKTYLPVLDQLLANLTETEKESVLTDFKLLVGSIILFAQPLPKASISNLLGTTESTVHRILDWLHSVLSVPSNRDSPVRLLHLSFRDFLVDPEKREGPFWIDEKEQHRTLAAKCLELLQRSDRLKTNICSLPSPGTWRADVDSQTITSCLSPELQYACCYWVYHLREGGARLSDDGQVHRFLKEHFLQWVESLCLLARISDSVTMILELQELLEADVSAELGDFLHDARRFILRNRTVVDEAPLQLYSSALVFAPQESIIKKQFGGSVPSWIRRLPEMESHWSPVLQTLGANKHVMLQFSEDNKLLTSIARDNTVNLWDPVTGALLQSLPIQMSLFVALSRDHRFLATASGKCIDVWDIATGERVHVLPNATDLAYGAAFSPDGNVLASRWGSTIELWDVHAGVKLRTLRITPGIPCLLQYSLQFSSLPSERISVITFSSDGNLLAAEVGGTISVWDITGGEPERILESEAVCEGVFTFSPGANILAAACGEFIEIWKPDTEEIVHLQETYSRIAISLEFSADGKRLASSYETSSYDASTVILWDVERAKPLLSWSGVDVVYPNSLAFSGHNNLLAFPCRGSIKVVDCASANVLTEFAVEVDGVTDMAFSGDGKILASASAYSTVKTWDVTPATLQESGTRNNGIANAAVSSDGKLLVTVRTLAVKDTMIVWDLRRGERAQERSEVQDKTDVLVLAFSADNKSVGIRYSSGAVKVWDLVTNEINTLGRIPRPDPDNHYIAFSNHCKLLAVASANFVTLWDLTTGKARDPHYPRGNLISALTFSEDDELLAVGTYGVEADVKHMVFNTITGGEPVVIANTGCEVAALAFSRDCRHLMSVGRGIDGTPVSLWNATTGQCLQTIDIGHSFGGSPGPRDDAPCVETSLGIFRVPSCKGEESGHKLQCPVKLAFLRGWIVRDGERLLRIPLDYAPRDRRGVGPSFGGNTFAWVNPYGFATVIEIECE